MKTILERWNEKVDKKSDDECWEWIGAKTSDGYGKMIIDKVENRAHRLTHELFIGVIEDGMVVRHHCDNTNCVNPKHLAQGTPQDNVDDRERRGRGNHGKGFPKGHVPWNVGIEHSEETKRLMGEKIKEHIAKHGSVWTGKKHSEETKKKMSESRKKLFAQGG